jgi:sortase A
VNGAHAADGQGPAASRARRIGYEAVGVVGELLITAGLLLLAFLAWQLWWTDVVGDRAQSAIVTELVSAAPSPAPSAPGQSGPAVAAPRHDVAPVMGTPAHAETFAALYVPRWGGDARPISEGTDRATVLDVKGIGHYEGTAMPGGLGNFAIAGHRTTYGKPFNRIAELEVGDPLVVWTADTWYVYRVTSTQIVSPSQTSVLLPVPNDPSAVATEATITLTSCHPMYSASQRYVVHGTLDYWAPTASGTPTELLGD